MDIQYIASQANSQPSLLKSTSGKNCNDLKQIEALIRLYYW